MEVYVLKEGTIYDIVEILGVYTSEEEVKRIVDEHNKKEETWWGYDTVELIGECNCDCSRLLTAEEFKEALRLGG